MRRLLWKEWREHLWWGLLWVAAIVGVSLFTHGQSFCGERVVWTNAWPALPLLLALLNGVGGYAGETKRGRAEFLLSRPLSGAQVLGGKLLFAASVCIGAPLLAALLFRLFGDPAYHPHVTLPHVLAGAGAVAWKHAVVYLFGLGCALVLPGFFGGMLTLAVVVVAVLTYVMTFGLCNAQVCSRISQLDPCWMEPLIWRIPLITIAAAWLAVLAAAWPLTRFGLTLTAIDRVKRYAVRFLPLLAVLWLVFLFIPNSLMQAAFTREHTLTTSVSPSGRYAIVARRTYINSTVLDEIDEMRHGYQYGDVAVYLVKLGGDTHPMQYIRRPDGGRRWDGENLILNIDMLQWLPGDIGFAPWAGQPNVLNPAQGTVKTYDYTPENVDFTFASPDGRYLLLVLYRRENGHSVGSFVVFDPHTGQRSRHVSGKPDDRGNASMYARWKSANEIIYYQHRFSKKDNMKHKVTRTIPLSSLLPLHPEAK